MSSPAKTALQALAAIAALVSAYCWVRSAAAAHVDPRPWWRAHDPTAKTDGAVAEIIDGYTLPKVRNRLAVAAWGYPASEVETGNLGGRWQARERQTDPDNYRLEHGALPVDLFAPAWAETHQGATCGFAAIRLGQDAKPGDVFVVERQLPEAAGLLQYEIKSEKDGHARVVRENQISDLWAASLSAGSPWRGWNGYSITSSACARIEAGIVRLSTFAVFMLTRISYRVGCSTGRSAGRSPLRILST